MGRSERIKAMLEKPAPGSKKKAAAKHPTPKKRKQQNNKNDRDSKKMAATTTIGKCMAWRHTLLSQGKKNCSAKQIEHSASVELVPYTSVHDDDNDEEHDLYWPAALFLNAHYHRGILVENDNDDDDDDDVPYFGSSQGYAPGPSNDGHRFLPHLSEMESALWCHKHASHMAVARRFPVEVARFLGTITLEIQEAAPSNKSHKKRKGSNGKATAAAAEPLPPALAESQKAEKESLHHGWERPPSPRFTQRVRRITHKHALGEAETEELQTSTTKDSAKSPTTKTRLTRSHEIMHQWQAIQSCEPYNETWDWDNGSITAGDRDEHHVSLLSLQKWLAKGIRDCSLLDLREDDVCKLYDGLTIVPLHALEIMECLVNLADPRSALYGVPLLFAYPRMARTIVRDSKRNQNINVVWKIQIGVYMHRLLPEIFTCQSLHVIMSALDKDSFKITQPIRLPPSGPAVFQSSPYPKVDTSVLEGHDGCDHDSKSDNDSMNGDLEGGSRDELVLSPFSTRGLLKLLENKGCDVSQWHVIERQLQGKFKLDLLLHQQHAICWMIQMEHLEGAYGINSLLWEQRTFPDGGHFYYSPALGQVRLGAPPPHMKGGILCDEQGMGKTVEVLGLIMATLSELKEQVQKNSEEKKKASYKYEGENYYSAESSDDEGDDYVTHTTLIIVPPALLAQWLHEIEKAVGKTTLSVCMLVAQTGKLVPCLPPPPKRNEHSSDDDMDDWDRVLASDIIVTTYDSLDKKCCSKVLQAVQWGRVVLDEMQEIRSSTTQIARNCEKLQCDRRWMLSGTPIYQGIGDLRGELNFLRLEPFGAALEDGFFKFAIEDPWDSKDPHAISMLRILGLVALRRSKDMTIAETGTSLLDLKPLTVEYIPVEQTPSERALYCFVEHLVACEVSQAKHAKQKRVGFVPPYPLTRQIVKKSDNKSRSLCLRLLRETCITPMLLNGGMGVPSQLAAIDKLMTSHHRREQCNNFYFTRRRGSETGDGSRKRAETIPIMSCEQAQRFLTQHTETARTSEDFVTDVAFGGGRGVSNRDRATETVEVKRNNAKDRLAAAEKALSIETKKRATARWHLALEMVTTGAYCYGRVHKFSGLWKWRRLVYLALGQPKKKATRQDDKNVKVARALSRGWRPSPSFANELYRKRPDFSWAHPYGMLAENIPKEICQKQLATACRDAAKLAPFAEEERESLVLRKSKILGSKHKGSSKNVDLVRDIDAKLKEIDGKMDEYKSHDASVKLPQVVKVRERKHLKGFWKAIVQFENEKEATRAMKIFGRANGLPVSCRRVVSHMKDLLEAATEKVSQVEAELQVFPSKKNKDLLVESKKQLAAVSLGLRICSTSSKASTPIEDEEVREKTGTSNAHIIVSKALGLQRSLAPRFASDWEAALQGNIAQSNTEIYKQKSIVGKEKRVLQKLSKTEVSEKTQQMSAYETLETLADGKVEATECCICLGHLGSEVEEEKQVSVRSPSSARKKKAAKQQCSASISMIKCGHLFCSPCLSSYVKEQIQSGARVKCCVCRSDFNLSTDTIKVDPSLKDEQEARNRERQAARELVREASKMLEESHGHLDAEMWRALYLAFDLPENVNKQGSRSFPAIDREFLTHLRAATLMPINCRPSDRPPPGSVKGAGRCSKILRLLEDIPRNERCVIFTSNKSCLMHLKTVLSEDNIECQAIYTGQSTNDLKIAVSLWEKGGKSSKDPPPFPCLLVQAGAAAAGLTLTAASKMFIMEPFLRQEEEKQAYARCHRYSQKHKVSVKVYYTPVSVESRLLEWRKGAKTALVASDASGNYEKDTKIVIHDLAEDSSDEEASGEDNSEDEDESDNDSEKSESHDIAQAEFLLGLHD